MWNNCQTYAKLIFEAGKGNSLLKKYLADDKPMEDTKSEMEITSFISEISETDLKNFEEWEK
jgi:hypothetical protein